MGFWGNVLAGLTGASRGGNEGASAGTSAQPTPNETAQSEVGSAIGTAAGTAATAAAAKATASVVAQYGSRLGSAAGVVEGPLGIGVGGAVGYGVGYVAGYATSHAIGYTYANREFIFNQTAPIATNMLMNVPILCFEANTEIITENNNALKIKDIEVGSVVLSFSVEKKEKCHLRPARVKRIFRNITNEWLILSSGLTVTPGHYFLNEEFSFEKIESIVLRKGSIINREGYPEPAVAKRVVYSEETRHLFEEFDKTTYLEAGTAAHASEIRRGWKTYNFEVEDVHTYIAGGYCVHNESIGDYNAIAGILIDAEQNGDVQTATDARAAIAAEFGPGAVGIAEAGFNASEPSEVPGAIASIENAPTAEAQDTAAAAFAGNLSNVTDAHVQQSGIAALQSYGYTVSVTGGTPPASGGTPPATGGTPPATGGTPPATPASLDAAD